MTTQLLLTISDRVVFKYRVKVRGYTIIIELPGSLEYVEIVRIDNFFFFFLVLGLAFEHSGWQSEQSWTFAEIFSDAIRHGLPAIQTQHPGLYYQQVS